MKILLFAHCRQAVGRDDCSLPLQQPLGQTAFWPLLVAAFPALAPFEKTARLARDGAYLQGDEMLNPDDEIALIPPVSGG